MNNNVLQSCFGCSPYARSGLACAAPLPGKQSPRGRLVEAELTKGPQRLRINETKKYPFRGFFASLIFHRVGAYLPCPFNGLWGRCLEQTVLFLSGKTSLGCSALSFPNVFLRKFLGASGAIIVVKRGPFT